MYQDFITTPDQALVHLAFHCSLKDGEFTSEELDYISATFVAKGLNKELNLKYEIEHYKTYRPQIKDETVFLMFLIDKIHPFNKLALFAFCAEIIYRDNKVTLSEEVLLGKIASLLYISDNDNLAIQKLITELNDVERKNAF